MSADFSTIRLTDIQEAARRLRDGQLVAFPTETVYGLGAHALDPLAVAGVFEAKQRPQFDPLIVHVCDFGGVDRIVSEIPPPARRLAEAFWPGPLTMILPKRSSVPDLVTSGLPGVGVRVPAHPVALELLQAADCPVAAPSANPFGAVSPTAASHVLQGLDGRIDAVLEGGSCEIGIESTVVSLMDQIPVILRLGGLPVESIVEVTGPIEIATSNAALDDAAQPAPGMLSRHYAPGTPIVLKDADADIQPTHPRTGLLTWGETPANSRQFDAVQCLSESGDLRECAANFFAALRTLDADDPDVIIARRFPDYGLGRALNDRLQRASG